MIKKDFDCVQMKHEIQQRLLEEMKGFSIEEEIRWTKELIASDPVLGPFWKKARRIQSEDSSPSEDDGKQEPITAR